MHVRKGDAYVLGLLAIVALSVMSVLCSPVATRSATIAAIFPGAILGVVGVTTAFIGGNVADNGVKGKFYNQGLNGESK